MEKRRGIRRKGSIMNEVNPFFPELFFLEVLILSFSLCNVLFNPSKKRKCINKDMINEMVSGKKKFFINLLYNVL